MASLTDLAVRIAQDINERPKAQHVSVPLATDHPQVSPAAAGTLRIPFAVTTQGDRWRLRIRNNGSAPATITGVWIGRQLTNARFTDAPTQTSGEFTVQPGGAHVTDWSSTPVQGWDMMLSVGLMPTSGTWGQSGGKNYWLDVNYQAGGNQYGAGFIEGSTLPLSWEIEVEDAATPLVHPVFLTRPLDASYNETVTSRSVRLPLTVPTHAARWRVVFRNANHRGAGTIYPGAVTLRTVCVGPAAVNAAGTPTGAFDSAGKLIVLRDQSVADLGQEFATDWIEGTPLSAGQEYLLAFGYQTGGQAVHLGMSGGWMTEGNPMNAELTTDPSATKVKRTPFDVRIEIEATPNRPTQVFIGDSIGAASSAAHAVRDAPIYQATRAVGDSAPLPNLHSFGGGNIAEWVGAGADPSSLKWADLARYGRVDRAVIMLGNNDINRGDDLATLQALMTEFIGLVRQRVSPNVVLCTITPRVAWATTEPDKEATRSAFNEWLATLPAGAIACVDTGQSVASADGFTPFPDYYADGIHHTTKGCSVIGQTIAAMVRPAAPGAAG